MPDLAPLAQCTATDDFDAQTASYVADPSSAQLSVFISSSSAKDPTWSARYPGKSNVMVLMEAKYEWFKEWSTERVRARVYARLCVCGFMCLFPCISVAMAEQPKRVAFCCACAPAPPRFIARANPDVSVCLHARLSGAATSMRS